MDVMIHEAAKGMQQKAKRVDRDDVHIIYTAKEIKCDEHCSLYSSV